MLENDQGCLSWKGKYQLEIKLSLWLRWVFGWRQKNRVLEGTAGRVGSPKVQWCPSLFPFFCLLSILLLILLFFLPLFFLMNKVRNYSIFLSSYICIFALSKNKSPHHLILVLNWHLVCLLVLWIFGLTAFQKRVN